MDAQQQLFSLMLLAEEQQKAVKTAIDGLAKERAAVAQAAASVASVASDVKRAAAESIPAMQRAVSEAVGASVRESLAGASDTAAKALGAAAQPVIGSLSNVVQAAHQAESSMRNAAAWFSFKWVALAAAGMVGVCGMAYASLAWQLYQIEGLRHQKAELEADVAQMQANVAVLEKKGGRIVISTCGGRICIMASTNQGKNAENWAGVNWTSSTGVPMVIPRGY